MGRGKKNFMNQKAWIVSASMGYGHQRAAHNLKHLAFENKIINANDYSGIPKKDKKIWQRMRKFYEIIARSKIFFALFDRFQKIGPVKSTLQLKWTFALIKKGLGKDLINRLSKNPRPLISTFFIPALAAEYFDYPGEIYCLICDTDVSRAWVSLEPQKSRIKYFAPTKQVVERLKLYGVRSENIFLTGFPLPQISRQKSDVLTLMFAVGGAGAQKEIGKEILKSLNKKIKIILSAGIRPEIRDYFRKLDQDVEIIFAENIEEYFEKFNQALSKTDILWTKPSELCFYTALGLPIIIAPAIGSQEKANQEWLLQLGSGIKQQDFELLDSDWLAKAAQQGQKAEKFGALNIEKILNR